MLGVYFSVLGFSVHHSFQNVTHLFPSTFSFFYSAVNKHTKLPSGPHIASSWSFTAAASVLTVFFLFDTLHCRKCWTLDSFQESWLSQARHWGLEHCWKSHLPTTGRSGSDYPTRTQWDWFKKVCSFNWKKNKVLVSYRHSSADISEWGSSERIYIREDHISYICYSLWLQTIA
jgi:hypothetical protein